VQDNAPPQEFSTAPATAVSPPLPEAAISITLKGHLNDHEVMATFRGTEWLTVKATVEEASKWLDAPKPQAEKQAANQNDMCDKHGVPWKINKHGRKYHMDGDQFCNPTRPKDNNGQRQHRGNGYQRGPKKAPYFAVPVMVCLMVSPELMVRPLSSQLQVSSSPRITTCSPLVTFWQTILLGVICVVHPPTVGQELQVSRPKELPGYGLVFARANTFSRFDAILNTSTV
jgi:hypothetical protein